MQLVEQSLFFIPGARGPGWPPGLLPPRAPPPEPSQGGARGAEKPRSASYPQDCVVLNPSSEERKGLFLCPPTRPQSEGRLWRPAVATSLMQAGPARSPVRLCQVLVVLSPGAFAQFQVPTIRSSSGGPSAILLVAVIST